MTDTPSLRFYALAILIVLAFIWIIVTYARLIACSWCREPFAIYPRASGDLCRSCARVFDHQRERVGRRRSLLRRIQIWRAA